MNHLSVILCVVMLALLGCGEATPGEIAMPLDQVDQQMIAALNAFNTVQPVHFVDRQGIIVAATQRELDVMGYAEAEYVGHSIADFHRSQAVITYMLTTLLDGGSLKAFPAELVRGDRSSLFVLINSSMVRDGAHTFCFTTEVGNLTWTERKTHEWPSNLKRLVAQE